VVHSRWRRSQGGRARAGWRGQERACPASQFGQPAVLRLFDRFAPRLEHVHRPVQVLQRQLRRPVEMDLLLQPLGVVVQLRGRRQRAIGDHREQGAFHVEVELAARQPHCGDDGEKKARPGPGFETTA
jgi:hypothetical protein